MEKNMTQPERETKSKANGWNARADFSPEEIESLLDGIDAVVSTYKAEREGIDPRDMVKTVRGGKTIWITKNEMNQILAKQRKISGVKYAQRSLRGEDSLSSEINRRIHICYELVVTIRRLFPKEAQSLTPLFRNLEAMHNQVSGLARDLRMLEQAIQRKRSEDEILSNMDDAAAIMADAVMKGNLEEAEICRQHCDRHMDQFLAKEKRLKPYLEKARELRSHFIHCRQRLLTVEFKLMESVENLLRGQLPELIYFDRKMVYVGELGEQADAIQRQIIQAKSNLERERDWSETSDEEAIRQISQLDKDYLSPLLRSLTMYCRHFDKAWVQLVVNSGKVKHVKQDTPAENAPSDESCRTDREDADQSSGVWVPLQANRSIDRIDGAKPSEGYHSHQTESKS